MPICIFDVDGTLLRLQDAENDTYTSAFAQVFGITNIDTDWNNYAARSDVGIAKEILSRHFDRPCSDEELIAVMDQYRESLKALATLEWEPETIEGVGPVLEFLSADRNVLLAVATAGLKLGAELRLRRAGLWQYFHCGGFGEDGDNKEVILGVALQRCKETWPTRFSLADCVFIGDSASDALAASRLGVRFVGVAEHDAQALRLRSLGSFPIVRSFETLSFYQAIAEA